MHPAHSAVSLRDKGKTCLFSCVPQAIGTVSLEVSIALQASACLPRLCVQGVLIHGAQVWSEQWSVNMEPAWILLWEQGQRGSLRRKRSIPWLGVGGFERQPLCGSWSSCLCGQNVAGCFTLPGCRVEGDGFSTSVPGLQQAMYIHAVAGTLLTATGYSEHQCPCQCGVPGGFTC